MDTQEGQALANLHKMIFAEVNVRTREAEEVLGRRMMEVVRTTTKIPLRGFYMHLLLWLNEDFDDDLLQDVIMMLTG